LSVQKETAPGRWPPVRAWAPPAFLITLGVCALGIALNNLFIPTSVSAASIAALAGKAYLQQLEAFDRNPLLIRTHAALGGTFVCLAALQFWRKFRNGDLGRHRLIGYGALTVLFLLPITGVASSIVYPIAGLWGVLPNVLWMSAILFCVGAAWRAIRRRDVFAHQAWVTRATAMTFGIVLTRAYEPLFVQLAHMDQRTAMVLVFWLGQGEGLAVAELWLRRQGGPLRLRAARLAARA
jgi:uncharacterized membrane protein YozB (DUF420 family)